jgi:hypothetical protein
MNQETTHRSNMKYTVTRNNKMVAIILMVLGVLGIAYGFMTDPHRQWANLLVDNFFFMAISLCGTFFVAVQYVANAGWSTAIKRVPEAMGQFLPVSAIIMLIIIFAHGHDLYHWMHKELFDPASPEYDKIIAGKQGYLNMPFFLIRVFLYFIVWILFQRLMRRESLAEDLDGSFSHYKRCLTWGAMFVVFFAASSSTSAWDFLMSIDTHWFSTMFGWYTFAGLFVSGLSTIMLILLYLKSRGYMPEVNENHLHDVGKFMFAFSIFWTYLWFCQFMLIWYANFPEEVVYFHERWQHGYKILFISNFFINFIMPFLILMSRDAKRNRKFLVVAASIICLGHWLDVFLMVMPGTVGKNWGLSPRLWPSLDCSFGSCSIRFQRRTWCRFTILC